MADDKDMTPDEEAQKAAKEEAAAETPEASAPKEETPVEETPVEEIKGEETPAAEAKAEEAAEEEAAEEETPTFNIGIVGIKQGMTRVFTEAGDSIPVTVIEASPNRVTQVKSMARDGYAAVQVTAGNIKPSRVRKPAAGHFSKNSVEAGRGLWELRLDADAEINPGDSLTVKAFAPGQKVDVCGQSKGKGFAGVVKRHNFKMQDATHGNSLSHRAPGSIGQCQTPGRVFKGKKMAGQMGAARVTAQTLEVVQVDQENNLLLVKGAVPGARGGSVIVTPAVKSAQQQ